MKVIKDFKCQTCKERLKEQDLFSLEKRRLGEILPMCLNILLGVWRRKPSLCDIQWMNKTQIYIQEIMCKHKKKIFYCKIIEHWTKFPTQVVDIHFLETLIIQAGHSPK